MPGGLGDVDDRNVEQLLQAFPAVLAETRLDHRVELPWVAGHGVHHGDGGEVALEVPLDRVGADGRRQGTISVPGPATDLADAAMATVIDTVVLTFTTKIRTFPPCGSVDPRVEGAANSDICQATVHRFAVGRARPAELPSGRVDRGAQDADHRKGGVVTTGESGPRAADVLVLFGITGDLARKLVLRALPTGRARRPDRAGDRRGAHRHGHRRAAPSRRGVRGTGVRRRR